MNLHICQFPITCITVLNIVLRFAALFQAMLDLCCFNKEKKPKECRPLFKFPWYISGAFVFPFVLMLLLLGLPLMFLELALGQYAALGPSVVFDRLCPLFHGKYLLNLSNR